MEKLSLETYRFRQRKLLYDYPGDANLDDYSNETEMIEDDEFIFLYGDEFYAKCCDIDFMLEDGVEELKEHLSCIHNYSESKLKMLFLNR